MPPRSPIFGHALIAAAVLGSLPALLPMLRGAELLPTAASPTAALASLALVAATGRVLLALLPPATNGGPATTWATSHLLGIILLSGQSLALAQLDLHPSLTALAAPWLLLGLAAWLTGPGDLVPRHAPARPAPSPLSRGLDGLTTALALTPLALHLAGHTLLLHTPSGGALGLLPGLASAALAPLGPAATPAVTLAALPAAALLVRHALAAAGASAERTAAVPLALVLLPAPFAFISSSAAAASPTPAALPLALFAATAAAAFGSIALLRADRRAALITLAAGLALAWLTPRALAPVAPALAAATPIALFFATPAPGRRRITTPLVLALAAGLAIGLTLALGQTSAAAPTTATQATPLAPAFAALASYDLHLFGTLFLLVDAAGLILLFRRPWSTPPRPRPALLFAFTLAALSCIFALTAQLLFGTLWPQPAGHWHTTAPQLLTLLAPSALLMLALSADELLPARG